MKTKNIIVFFSLHLAIFSFPFALQLINKDGGYSLYAQKINGTRNHSIVLCSNGTAWTTGLNNVGQLGDGTTTDKTTPVQVTALSNIIAVSAGGWINYHTLALQNTGTVWAWGQNTFGQLGNGTLVDSPVPVAVSGLNNIIALAGGEEGDFSIALRNDGTIWTWG